MTPRWPAALRHQAEETIAQVRNQTQSRDSQLQIGNGNGLPRDSLAPGCCWLVFTDQVLHAALGGEFALEQTFHLDIAEMAEPERAPVKVLERLSGKTLV